MSERGYLEIWICIVVGRKGVNQVRGVVGKVTGEVGADNVWI